MANELEHFQGLRVIESSFMSEFIESSNKKLDKKRWMDGKCYFKRISKKWDKRFGVKKEPLFFVNGNSIITHPSNVSALRRKIVGFNCNGACHG